MEQKVGLSSITVTKDGTFNDKKTGKKITQRFVTKIYSDKLGEEARVELQAIMDKMESGSAPLTKKEEEEGEPKVFTT